MELVDDVGGEVLGDDRVLVDHAALEVQTAVGDYVGAHAARFGGVEVKLGELVVLAAADDARGGQLPRKVFARDAQREYAGLFEQFVRIARHADGRQGDRPVAKRAEHKERHGDRVRVLEPGGQEKARRAHGLVNFGDVFVEVSKRYGHSMRSFIFLFFFLKSHTKL